MRWDAKEGKAFVKVDDKDYPNLSELVPMLQERLKADPKVRAVIRGDQALPAIEIQRVMNLVGEGGIHDISFAASNKIIPDAKTQETKQSSEVHLGFQIAPMVDVVFVIMLFFMVLAGSVQVENAHNTKLPGTVEVPNSRHHPAG